MSHQIIIICGVSGCGKSTVGNALAQETGWRFIEGDDHHPEENIAKMTSGIPLTDRDRAQWLNNICEDILSSHSPYQVLACSALTPYVQSVLRARLGDRINWIKLTLTKDEALKRMSNREHFMPPELMESQFAAWHPPAEGLEVSAKKTANEIVDGIIDYLKRQGLF